jgi:hypothetical protein
MIDELLLIENPSFIGLRNSDIGEQKPEFRFRRKLFMIDDL